MSPAVRNIRSLGRIKPIPVYIWIPPIYGAKHRITVTRSDGTVDDITNIIPKGDMEDGATETIGRFSFEVDNSGGIYTNAWTGGDIVKVFIDYSATATTLRFRGIIENASNRENLIKIIGRTETSKLLERSVNYQTTNETSIILKQLFDDYATEFTYSNVTESTTITTVNWFRKPMFECIQELCRVAGFDFYIDPNLDVHFFEIGSVKNTTEAVVHGMNIISVDDFGQDYSLIKNKIIVEGGNIGGFPLIYASTSDDPNYGINSSFGLLEKVIKDQNISSESQARERADAELAFFISPNTVGEAESLGLSTIQPGEQIKVSAPDSNLPPAYYTIISYKHKFGAGMRTVLMINKEAIKLQKILRDRIVKDDEVNVRNIFGRDFSWNFDFELNSGIHSSTQISDGALKTDGVASGTWISDVRSLNSNIDTTVQLLINGTSLVGTKVRLSTDGGTTYKQVWGVGSSLSVNAGKNLKIQVDLNSADTQITGLVLLYK